MITIFDYEKIQFRKKFGGNLKRIRKIKKFSQQKLSDITGIDRAFLSVVENGRKSMSVDTLYKIKKALKVDMKRFFE
jgi:transcriptional regulator with XRE-family HTH domain